MRVVFRRATVLALDDAHGSIPFAADVAVTGDRITGVGPELAAEPGDQVVDASGKLLMPGMVNAHSHSWEAFFRGRYENLPLELWMLLAYPLLGVTPLPPEVIRLRTLLLSIESLHNGVTCVLDDVVEMPGQSMEALAAVFDGYATSGLRASCSGNMVDRAMIDTLPFVDELVPPDLLAEARAVAPRSAGEHMDFAKEAIARFDGGPGARLRYAIAPSAPQRCTDELLAASAALSAAHDTTLHIHVLETKLQAVTGEELYGKTLVEHLASLGVLSERLTIAHGIWLTDDDIGLLAEAGTSIAHNPISNQKLGAGILPWRRLLDAGVNLALGSDGTCSNDSVRMFDVMRAAALLHSVSSPDPESWPTAAEVLFAATRGGARSVRAGDHIGAIEVGRAADLILVDMRTPSFTPLNDIPKHLVYLENGSSVDTVMVAGEIVLADRRCTRFDEDAVLDEIRRLAPAILRRHAEVERINRPYMDSFSAIHRRAASRPLPMNRYSGDERAWLA